MKATGVVGIACFCLFVGLAIKSELVRRHAVKTPPPHAASANVVVGAPLHSTSATGQSTPHAVRLTLQPAKTASGEAWILQHRSGDYLAQFKIELDPPSSSDETGVTRVGFGKGRLVRLQGSNGTELLRQLAVALEANGYIPPAQHLAEDPFTYSEFGRHLSPAPGGGYQFTPAGDWIAVKLFLGDASADKEGQVFLFYNPTTHQAEIAEKDADYGDIVLEHFAAIL